MKYKKKEAERNAMRLTVHDDQMISRVAYLIEFRQKRIAQLRKLIQNYKPTYDPRMASLESLQKQLALEQSNLDELLTDLMDGRLVEEVARIRKAYLSEGTQKEEKNCAEF